jgi:hypothetical protein
MTPISASRMTSHLSSRVLWNWRKRERGKEALPRVRVWNAARPGLARPRSAKTSGIPHRCFRASTLEGTRRNESVPPQERYRLVLPSCVDADCDRPIVDQINYRVRPENASVHRSGGPILLQEQGCYPANVSESSCFRRRLFKNLGVIQR